MKRFSPWLKLALIPLAVNLVLWQLLYIPRRAALRGWQQTGILLETRPKIEVLLKESRESMVSWEPTRFSRKNPSAAAEVIQQLAGRYDLYVHKLQTQEASLARKGKPAAASKNAPAKIQGFSTMSISLDLRGSFSQMVRWISDLESQYGFQIDSWQIIGSSELSQPTQMTVQVTALLGDPAGMALMPLPVQAALEDIDQTTRQLSQAMKSYRDQEKEPGKDDTAFRRDPMQALVDSKGQPIASASTGVREGPWLQGIIWSDTHPLVAVGDQLFSKGDVVGPCKIIEIYPDRVVVQKGDQQETISLDRWTEEKEN